MSSFSFRVVHDGGLYELPNFVEAKPGFEFSDISGFEITYPKNGINAAHLVEDATVIMYVDGIERKNSRWVIQGLEGDKNPEVANFKAMGRSVPSAFEKVIVLATDEAPGEDVRFDRAKPGGLLDTLFTAAQARGAMTGFAWAGDDTADADGEVWASVVSLTYRLGVKYMDVLRNLVDQELIEWSMNGMELELHNADSMGVDTTLLPEPVVFRQGKHYTETPFRTSTASRLGYGIVLGDDKNYVEVINPGVVGPFGREEAAFSQGGTKDHDMLLQVGQAQMALGSQIRKEYTRNINLQTCEYVPLVDFEVSDYVYEQVDGSVDRYRIRSMVLTVDKDGAKGCSIVLNDKFLENEIRIARRVNGILGGASNDGGGNGLPAENTPDTTTPNAPTGLVVDSTAYVNTQGITRATLAASWNAPANNTDGSAISDLKDYTVHYKRSADALWSTATTSLTSISLTDMDPGTDVQVRVRANDNSTHSSDWTAVVSHTTEVDDIPPGVPSQPAVTPLFGAVAVAWDGKDDTGAAMPPDFRATEVHMSTANDFAPNISTLVAAFPYPNGGKHLASNLVYGTVYYFKLVSVDRLGNRSAPSAQGSAVPIQLTGDDVADNSIGTGQVDFDARDLGANKTFRGPTEPAEAIDGDFWIDTSPTDHDVLNRLSAGVWEPVDDDRIANIILENEQQAQDIQAAYEEAAAKVSVYWQTSAPAGLGTEDVNDLWIDQDDSNKTYVWDGDSWELAADQRIAQALDTADAAQRAAAAAAAVAENKLLNGGFESELDSWTLSGDPSPPWLIDPTKGRTGSTSARADADTDGILTVRSLYHEDIPVSPGRTYRVEAWYQTTPDYNGTGGNGKLRLGDQNGALLGSVPWTAGMSEWTPAQLEWTAPEDGSVTALQVHVSADHTLGKLWVDDVSVKDVTESLEILAAVNTKITVFFQDSQPATINRTIGDVWYETDNDNKSYRWDGSAWAAYQLGATAISATARQLGAITTYYQASQPASGMLSGDFWVDTDDNRKLYRYSGAAWQAADDTRIVDAINAAAGAQAAADGKVRTFAQATAPTGLTSEDDGDLWVDTDDENKLYRWSGTGAAWVLLSDERIAVLVQEMADAQADIAAAVQAASDAQATADGKVAFYFQTSPPTGAQVGDYWIDQDTNEMFRWSSGSVWESVQDEEIQTALTNAAAAKSTADGKITTYWQASAPAGTHAIGDLWFDTDDDNKPSWWNGSSWAAIPLGANAIKPGSLTLGNLVSEVRASLGQVFYDDFSDTSRWEPVARLGTFTSVAAADARSGSNVGRFTGDTNAYRAHKTLVPYDPGQLYRITVRVRENTASSAARFYAGVLGIAADGVTKVNIIGQDSTSSQFYCAAAGEDVGGAWVEYVGYIKGTADPGESGKSADPKAPRHLHDSVRYIRPLMIFNYAGVAADVMEVDMFKLEAVPVGLVERTNIALAAINSALIEDLAVVSAKIGNLAVTTAKIADLAVTTAKIQSLVATKITTGELAAGVAIYAGSATGNHARMTDLGFFVGGPNEAGVVQDAVRMGTSTGDRFAIVDPTDPTGETTLASISDQGIISGQGLTVPSQDEAVFGGDSLREIIDRLPRGPIASGFLNGAGGQWGPTTGRLGIGEVSFYFDPSRQYIIHLAPMNVYNTGAAGAKVLIGMRYTTGGTTPTVSNGITFHSAIVSTPNQGQAYTAPGLKALGSFGSVPTLVRILVTIEPFSGGAANAITYDSNVAYNTPFRLWVEDAGPDIPDTYIPNSGGGSTVNPKTRYTSEWVSSANESYQGDGDARTDTTDLVQGYYSSINGNGWALAKFLGGAVSGETGKTVAQAMSGATLERAWVYLYFNHWYYNSGGTAIIRAHNGPLNNTPPSGNYIASSSWPKPGGRWVEVTSIWSTARDGFWLGPGLSTDLGYYGRANGGSSPRYRAQYVR